MNFLTEMNPEEETRVPLTLKASTANGEFEITVFLSPEEWRFIEKEMIPNSATHSDVAIELLCARTEVAERKPLLLLLAAMWKQKVPKESQENLLKFLDAYYREDCDSRRTKVRLGSRWQEQSHIAWWVGRAIAPDTDFPHSNSNAEGPTPDPPSVTILGEKLQHCILSRDHKWLQDLSEFLKALPRNPVLGDSLKDLVMEMQAEGGTEGRKRIILDEFQKHIKKFGRLPTVGELNEACDLDKDNSRKYRKELGFSGLPARRKSARK